MTAYLRKFVKWFYTLFAIAAITMAVIVQAGRSFAHLLADYPREVSSYLSHKLNADVSLKAISAEWTGLKPMVDVQNVRVTSRTGQPIISLTHAQLRLDILGTIAHARLVWSVLQLDGVETDFIQSNNGLWQLSGLPEHAAQPHDNQSARLDDVIDTLLLSRRIGFSNSKINLHFVSGAVTKLGLPMLRLESADKFHRLSLEVDVDGHPKTLTLVAEGHGDPRKIDSFTSKAFVQLRQFPTDEPLAATTAFLLRGIKTEVHSEGKLDASLWFSSRDKREGFDVVGTLGIQRLNMPVLNRTLSLDSFTTNVAGKWFYNGQWQLALQRINATVNQFKIEQVSFAASAANFSAPIILHIRRLDLDHLNKTLDSAGVFGADKLREVMRQLNPTGIVQNLQVSIPTDNPKAWQIEANLSHIGVDAWQGVPALRKVDGFVHASQQGGFVDIDSHNGFSMHYSPTYSAPMEYRQAKGQVAWWLQPDRNQIYVNSGALEFTNGDEYAKGYMWLSLPWQRNTGDIDLYLQIGARKLDASLYSKYTPAVVPASLLDWLKKSIGSENSGYVNEVGFLYRGTLNNPSHAARSHQLFLDIAHAQLNYHPEWPALGAIDGRLLVNDDKVEASVDNARLFDSDVGSTEISARPNPDGHGSLLRVVGSVSGGAEDGLRVLRETMLRRYIGNSMDTWKLDGQIRTKLDIAVPLDHLGTGAGQKVDVELQARHFEMANLKLSMQNVAGRINFNDRTGLTSQGLKGVLFDEPVTALLSTKKLGDASQTLVEVNGDVDGRNLAKWTQRPEVLFLQGRIPYKALIELNHKAAISETNSGAAANSGTGAFAVVTVNSSLSGVGVELPKPYDKSRESERPLLFKMSLFERTSLIKLSYDDHLQALFELDAHSNKLLNANIALGADAKLAARPQFLLSGNLPGLDIELWKKVQQQYADNTAQIDLLTAKPASISQHEGETNANPTLVAGLPFRAHVLLVKYQVGPLALENIDIEAEHLPDSWRIAFTNPLAIGDIYLPNDTANPIKIHLDALRLTSSALGLTTNNTMVGTSGISPDVVVGDVAQKLRGQNIDPRSMPLANLSVNALYMDSINYGNWSLQIRPNENGVLFNNIRGTVKGVTVDGIDDKLGGAKLEWTVKDEQATTHFAGSLATGDMSAVLRDWQKPDMLESTASRFAVDVMWNGDPQDFALKKIAGNIEVWIQKGRFKNNPSPGSDGLLRLMAILNFDSLARRLRLDFTDLYKSGLAYDEIVGKVNFVPGVLTFVEPLSVKTPSSRLQLVGKLDLEREKIDARLVATLPVVGSYTFFTALVTGLPAAAGLYVVSKLFKKQVDRATSISYSIRGNWGDPVMSFDRLFESEDELLRSVNSEDVAKPNRAKTEKKKKADSESSK